MSIALVATMDWTYPRIQLIWQPLCQSYQNQIHEFNHLGVWWLRLLPFALCGTSRDRIKQFVCLSLLVTSALVLYLRSPVFRMESPKELVWKWLIVASALAYYGMEWNSAFSTMEQRTFKNVNNCLNTNIYSYLETSGSQSSNLFLNMVPFFNTRIK